MKTATDTLENLNAGLINMTAALADAALAPISETLLQQLSEMMAKAQEQLSAMQVAKNNAVHLDR